MEPTYVKLFMKMQPYDYFNNNITVMNWYEFLPCHVQTCTMSQINAYMVSNIIDAIDVRCNCTVYYYTTQILLYTIS